MSESNTTDQTNPTTPTVPVVTTGGVAFGPPHAAARPEHLAAMEEAFRKQQAAKRGGAGTRPDFPTAAVLTPEQDELCHYIASLEFPKTEITQTGFFLPARIAEIVSTPPHFMGELAWRQWQIITFELAQQVQIGHSVKAGLSARETTLLEWATSLRDFFHGMNDELRANGLTLIPQATQLESGITAALAAYDEPPAASAPAVTAAADYEARR